jgi:hypothetical protein
MRVLLLFKGLVADTHAALHIAVMYFILVTSAAAGSDDDLVKAVVNNDLAKVQSAIAAGANPNVTIDTAKMPLMIQACLGNDLSIIQILLAAGADPNCRSSIGVTPLHACAYNGNSKALLLLLEKGAQVDAQQEQGATALMCAAQGGHFDAVATLLAAGANLEIKSKFGGTALTLAPDTGKIVRLLIDKSLDKVSGTPHSLSHAQRTQLYPPALTRTLEDLVRREPDLWLEGVFLARLLSVTWADSCSNCVRVDAQIWFSFENAKFRLGQVDYFLFHPQGTKSWRPEIIRKTRQGD